MAGRERRREATAMRAAALTLAAALTRAVPCARARASAAALWPLVLATALAALAVAAAGCDMPSTGGLGQVQGSGELVTRTYDFTGFTRLEVGNGFTVRVERGDMYAVSASVDDNLVEEHLQVELEGETLRIRLAPLWRYVGVTATATVTMPSLQGVEASGASTVEASGFASGDPLAIDLSGASSLALADVRAGGVTVELSGESRAAGELVAQELAGDVSGGSALEVGGSAGRMRLGASGGSRLTLSALEAGDAGLELSSGSHAIVLVTGTLDADLSGGSRLEYEGSPRLGSMDTSGGSVVEPAGQ